MSKPILIRKLLLKHFAPGPLDGLVILRARFPQWIRPDVLRAVERSLGGCSDVRVLGARMRGSSLEFRFTDLVEEGNKGVAVGPPVYDDLDLGEAEPVRCPQRALWLAGQGDGALAVLMDADGGFRRPGVHVEVAVAKSAEAAARDVLARIRSDAEQARSFRGKVLAPSQDEYSFDESPTTLRIAQIAPVVKREIILAPGVLELVERNTIGFAAQCEALVRLGMSGHKGVLLYGPPGTGKTFLVRYLANALEGHTTFLLSGDRLGWLADTVEAARLLAPAMVVIEDVDLIAAHRDGPWQSAPAALNRLLNDMDGAGPDARILFVLTTNRPEVLEPALAARPGRVDQAIEIGLPGESERRRLVKRYAGSLRVADDLATETAKRVGRTSPAFIKETMRRAAQAMLERGGDSLLERRDIERALEDMLGAGGKLAARMSGAESAIGFASLV